MFPACWCRCARRRFGLGIPVPARQPAVTRRQADQVRDAVGAAQRASTYRPASAPMLGDPTIPLFITEGTRRPTAARCTGCASSRCSASGAGWAPTPRGQDGALATGTTSRSTVAASIIAFDGDIARKAKVQKAARDLAGYLRRARAPRRVPVPARHRRQDRPGRLPGGAHRRGPVESGASRTSHG